MTNGGGALFVLLSARSPFAKLHLSPSMPYGCLPIESTKQVKKNVYIGIKFANKQPIFFKSSIRISGIKKVKNEE